MKRPIFPLLMLLPLFALAQQAPPPADLFAEVSGQPVDQDLPETNALWQETSSQQVDEAQPGYLSISSPTSLALSISTPTSEKPIFSTASLTEPFFSLPAGSYLLRYHLPGQAIREQTINLQPGVLTQVVCP